MKRTTLALAILAISSSAFAAETPDAIYNGADNTTAILAEQPSNIPAVGDDIADGAGTVQEVFFADEFNDNPTPAALARGAANTVANALLGQARDELPAATGDEALSILIGDGVFGAAAAAVALPTAFADAAAAGNQEPAVAGITAVPTALIAGLTGAAEAFGVPTLPGLPGGEEPEPEPAGEKIGSVVISATGTAAAANEDCEITSAPVAFDFGSGASYATAVTRALGGAPISVTCGADRAASATVFLSTTDTDTPSEATDTVSGKVGDATVVFTIKKAGPTAADDTAIGSAQAGTVAKGQTTDFDLAATYDKTGAKDGGAISFNTGSAIYVVIQ